MVQRHAAADARKPYSGLSRSLVIAIDVGTTFSGVSYAILEPGEIPKIHGVTRFPGQEHVAGNSKIPSVIYYDRHGNIMAAGAEAEASSVVAQAEDEGWIKAELFKLRLRPRTMQLNMNGMRLSPLPKRKTPVHVFGDYLAYLYRCTRSFISDTHANGQALWNSVEPDIQFVLSHPNGWEGPQQTRMRNAAVYGKLVPDTDAGKARIRFVTEGEASLHACVLSGLAADVLSNPSKHGFLICDAGGGTLDISAYAIKGTSPLTMEEIAPPDCIFAGSVFVSRRAREFLEEKLKHSKYGTPDSLDHITRKFDETTKRLFRDRHELQFIPFGSPLDRDSAVGIRSGQLRLSGNEVANLFEPSVDAAFNAIKRQIDASNGMIRSVFLVGGYAASSWLFGQLQERLRPYKVTVSRPDTQTSKAVADGAIGFYCDHHVSARMSKFMYGVEFLRELDPNNPDHVARKEKLCELPSGPKLLPDAFDCILARGVKVKESTVFTRKYCTELTNLSMLSVFEVEIWCYRGGNVVPQWIDRHDDAFSTLCVVQADLSMLNGSAEPKVGKNGKKYWTIVFSVEIHFGLTEFKARIKWMDNGQVKYGPAVIVYNERGHRVEDYDVDTYPEDDVGSQQRSRSDRQRSAPSSPRTPIDSQYPPNGGSASSSRRASAIPDVAQTERSASKGYSPSVAPSHRSGGYPPTQESYRGGDGEKAGSDSSDRRKGKERESMYREEDRDRGFSAHSETATPLERNRSSAYGVPPMSKTPSAASNHPGGEMPPTDWNAYPPMPGSMPQSRAPSVHAQSRTASMYGGATDQPLVSDFSGPPRPAIDEQRHSHLFDAPPTPRSPTLDAKQDRPKTPVIQDTVQERPKTPLASEQADRPKTPFAAPELAAPTDFGASSSPFLDRPKSGIEGTFLERPKSAFGGAQHSVFGDSPPPAMFGDAGPAADIGTSNGLFGDPPASVVTEPAATDAWGFPPASTPVAESPATTTKSGKKKKKNATGQSTPASGLASRASPLLQGDKSPLGTSAEPGLLDEPLVAAVTTSPAAAPGSLWGLKNPSPLDKGKPLSPLNPASQINHDASPAAAADDFTWGSNANDTGAAAVGDTWGSGANDNEGTAGGDTWGTNDGWGSVPAPEPQATVTEGGAWGNISLDPQSTQERAPSPPPQSAALAEEPPAEEFREANTPGKKKKKKGGANTPGKSPAAEKAELDRLAAEAEAEKAKQEEERLQKELAELEKVDKEEKERLEKEEKEKKEQEEKEKKEQEEKEKEQKEKEERDKKEQEEKEKASFLTPTSIFGNSAPIVSGGLFSSSSLNPPDKPWLSTDTGGGDDSWGGWGTTAGKKKKGSKATTPISAKPSVFGSAGGWGPSFGTSLGQSWGGLDTASSPKPSPKPSLVDLPSTQTTGLFNFGSGPDINLSLNDSAADTKQASKAPSRAQSPAPAAAESEDKGSAETPAEVASPLGETAEAWDAVEGGEGDGGAVLEGEADEDKPDDAAAGATSKKKKKKKSDKSGAAGNDEVTSPVDTPREETPQETTVTGGKKKKKKK